MKRASRKRSVSTRKSRKNSNRASARSQRNTSRGSERVREYRGTSRYDFADDRDYDMYDRDLRNYHEEGEYGRRGGNGRLLSFEGEYPRSHMVGKHRRHEWDEGFGNYNDYDEYEDTYEGNYGMSEDMEDLGYDELYRGHRKRVNTSRGFSDLSLRSVEDRARNRAGSRGRGKVTSGGRYADTVETSRGDRRGGTAGRENRSGSAFHTSEDMDISMPSRRRRKTPRRAFTHVDENPRVSSRYGSSPRGEGNSERSGTRRRRSKLGNSAPGSHIIEHAPKTRKRRTQYIQVVDTTPVVTRSKRRGNTSGKKANKDKVIKNP